MVNDPWRFYSVPAGGRARAQAPSALDDFYAEFEEGIEAEQEQRRAARAAASLAQPDDPKVVAKSVAIARDLNMTPTVVQADIPGYEAVQRMQKARAVGVVPGVSEWLSQPSNAAIASDNLDALRTVIGTARDYSSLGGSPYLDRARRTTRAQMDRAMTEKRWAGAADRKKARQVAALMGRASEDAVATGGTMGRLGAMARSRMMSLQGGGGRTVLGLLDAVGVERNSDLAQWFELRSLASEYQAARPIAGVTTWEKFKEAPTLGGLVSYVVEQGASSAIDMAALANPYGAVAWVGMQSGSTAQSRALNDRRAETIGADFLISVPTTTASALLERFGMSKIFGSTAKTIVGRIVQAVGAEALTEALQNPLEYAATTVGTKKGFDVWEAIDNGLAGAVAGGGLGGAVRGTVEAVEASQRKLTKLREVMDQSAESETRKRDPGAFRSLMSALTEGDAENLYIPADKIVAFNQDYRNDEFWGSYRDEIDDALESGGEVVIPVADAAARLAGTEQWAGIERDVRASPGGMSLNEIDAAKKDADALREQADAAAPVQSAPDAPAILRKSIRDALMNAGMTPDVADTNAGIVQALFETRAARLGVELTGREFDPVAVQRVLPEGLRAVGTADNLDLVISAMRASVKAAPQETVLDWIVKQGGVLDTGGDIASMGKPPKGMIIERDPAQMTMLAPAVGLNDRSLDNVARDAFNEGFIESDSTDALLEAIGRGLRGEAAVRLADQVGSQTDAMRRAANDLAQLLDEAGLDQATASKAEIEAAIAVYTDADAVGRSLDQPAFHGSPHIFDKFSLDYMGSGEGAQAYGWGLYFAGRKEVAEYYREVLAGRNVESRNYRAGGSEAELGKLFEKARVAAQSAGAPGDAARAIAAEIRDALEEMDGRPARNFLEEYSVDPAYQEAYAAAAEAYGDLRYELNEGRLYEVDIPEDSEYLLWDKPMSEQTKKVREALEKSGFALEDPAPRPVIEKQGDVYRIMHSDGVWTGTYRTKERAQEELDENYPEDQWAWTGEKFYRQAASEALSRGLTNSKGERAASLALKDAGIAGIKYLDGSSRSRGAGSFNYVVFDDSRVSISAYEQNVGGDPQGQISFLSDGQALIRLFESANLSTFQHEVAHFWLERFKVDAEAGATEQTLADWEALKAWFAENDAPMNDDGTIPEAAHEMFARGWERYLMEGKAPSTRLQRAFRLFAAWMRSIYRTVRGLNVPITPEVREVMDRMLATDEEIAAAQAEYQTRLLFDDATAAQMGDAAFRDYATLADESRIRANEELLGKVMRSVRARVTKEYRAEETALRTEIAAEVDARPVFAALNLLRSKGGPRISKSWLVETYGADVVKALPAGLPIWSDRGDHADTIAEQAGFNSGDAMVRALIDLEQLRQTMRDGGDTRSVRTATIDGETQTVMNERYGDPLADGSIEREAIAAIQNERQGELLALELRQLARRTGKRETPYAFAKRWAEERIASGVVNEVASGAAQYRFTQAAAKAGRAAEQALLKQDYQEAFRQKQVQLLQMAQARAAAAAGERVEKAVKRMGDLAKQRTVKSMDQGYLDQIHALLEDYEFKRVSQRELNARDSYARWAAEQTALGHDVVAVERLAQKKNWSRLTVDELIALDDAVKQLRHLGRLKRELIDNKNRRDFDEVVGEAVMSAGLLRQRKPKGTFTDPSWWDSIKRGVASLDAALLKMEEVFDWLDKGKFGVFNRVVFKPLVEAQETERRMIDDYMGRMIAAMGSLPKRTVSRLYDKRVIPELVDLATGESAVMTGERLLMMALNVGNAGNFEKLVGGFQWDTQLGSMEAAQATVMEVLNRELTADDWAYVQTVWDTIDELWPAIRDLETRVNGVAPDKVEAVPVATAGGTLRGGYFPVIYDSESRVGQRNLEIEERGLFPASYTRATTRAGSTRERTEFRGPLELTMGVINRHVAEVIHDITHREAVMNADKFLSDTRVQDAVTASLGPEIAAQFRPWLQHIANEWAADREANSRAEKGIKALRTNATVVGIGFRLSTVLMQISGYANSIERIGTVAVARGVMQLRSPDNWRFALDKSLELRGRMSSMDRDIRAASQRMASRQRRALDSVQRFAFHGIGWMDRLVSVGSWLGAYDKALRQGLPEDQAVYEADKAIRQSQGSGAAKDLARVQRGTGKTGEAWKLVTMFYSYASAFYQRQRRLGRDTMEAIRERDLSAVPEILARYFWLYIVPALASQWIAGNGPGEDEDEAQWAMWQITTSAVMAVPVVRDIVGAFGSGFGYMFTPAEGFGRSVVSVYRDAENIAQGEETKRATRNAMEAAGYATGRVPGQFATSAQFLVDVYYDEQNPETIGEWYEGLMKGKVKED